MSGKKIKKIIRSTIGCWKIFRLKKIFDGRKYVHFMINEKFNNDLIEFINSNFKSQEHVFIISKRQKKDPVTFPNQQNVVIINDQYFNQNHLKIIAEILSGDNMKKIVFHGLNNNIIVNLFSSHQQLLAKSAWLILGGDLYYYENKVKDEKLEEQRRAIISNIRYLVSYVNGDIKRAREWYGAKGKHIKSFLYVSNLFVENKLELADFEEKEKFTILAGHSGNPGGNHFDMIKMLHPYQDKIKQIICPLSYGCSDVYREEIIKKGVELFGDKFFAIKNLMPLAEYQKLLQSVDIGIIMFPCQKAFGNIVSLLSFGKKLYLNPLSANFDTIKDLGFNIYDANQIGDKKTFFEFSKNNSSYNVTLAKNTFSKSQLKEQWQSILSQ